MSETHDGAAEVGSEDTTAADLVTEDTADDQDADGDDATAQDDADGEGDKPKPKRTAQERIDELTRDKHAERRRADALEREIERLRPKQDAEEPKEEAEKEPDPADFTFGETDPGFIKALARYEGRQAYREEAAKDRQQNQARTVEQDWNERQQAFAKDKPDYAEKVHGGRDGPKWDCSPAMAAAIKTSDLGAAVAYHLASNPDEARRIAGMNDLASIKEIGRLEARFDTKAAPQREASDAPPPPQQVRGGGGRFAISPATTDFAAFEKMVDAKR